MIYERREVGYEDRRKRARLVGERMTPDHRPAFILGPA
jgi:hypothetical protein